MDINIERQIATRFLNWLLNNTDIILCERDYHELYATSYSNSELIELFLKRKIK